MSRRRNILPLAVALLAVGVLGLGTLLAQFPGRGVEVPLMPEQALTEPGFEDYFTTGVHLLQVGMPDQAAAAFEAASRLRPHVVEAKVNLGYAYLATRQYREAETAFRTALDLRPQQTNGYYGWAQSLEALDDLPAALGAMRTYVHLSAEDDPYRRRAMAAIWEWEVALKSSARGTADRNPKEDQTTSGPSRTNDVPPAR